MKFRFLRRLRRRSPTCPAVSPHDRWPCDLPDTLLAHTLKRKRAHHEHTHSNCLTSWEAKSADLTRWKGKA